MREQMAKLYAGGVALRIPMRGYEVCAFDSGNLLPVLRIPMRGYELSGARGIRRTRFGYESP